MVDTLKYLFFCTALLLGLPSFATPVLDVASLPENHGLKLAPFFRYIQLETPQATPEQALAESPWLSGQDKSPNNFYSGETWIKLNLANSSNSTKKLVLVQANPQIYDFTL